MAAKFKGRAKLADEGSNYYSLNFDRNSAFKAKYVLACSILVLRCITGHKIKPLKLFKEGTLSAAD